MQTINAPLASRPFRPCTVCASTTPRCTTKTFQIGCASIVGWISMIRKPNVNSVVTAIRMPARIMEIGRMRRTLRHAVSVIRSSSITRRIRKAYTVPIASNQRMGYSRKPIRSPLIESPRNVGTVGRISVFCHLELTNSSVVSFATRNVTAAGSRRISSARTIISG